MQTLPIGQLIEQRRKAIGMSKVEFARKLGMSRQNGFMLTRRQSIQTEMLQRISSVLSYDFFALFTDASSKVAAEYDVKIQLLNQQILDKEQLILHLQKEKEEMLNENTVIKKLLLKNGRVLKISQRTSAERRTRPFGEDSSFWRT